MPNITFDESSNIAPPIPGRPIKTVEDKAIIGFLIKNNIVKTKEAATYLLFGVVAVCIAVTVFVLYKAFKPSGNPLPPGYQMIEVPGDVPRLQKI